MNCILVVFDSLVTNWFVIVNLLKVLALETIWRPDHLYITLRLDYANLQVVST